MSNIAAFLDFQGTLGGQGFDDMRGLALFPFTAGAVRRLNERGILAVGITNQSHIAKGELSWEDYHFHLNRIHRELAAAGAHLDGVYCCPHDKADGCSCKKPLPGLTYKAREELDIDLSRSFVVGDMGMSDMLLAKAIGAKGVLVLTGVGEGSLGEFRHTWAEAEADHITPNLDGAVDWILASLNPTQLIYF
jgi:histidinol-phosphate phosphatase family protein